MNRVWPALVGLLAGAGLALVLIDLELSTQAETRMDRFGTTMADLAAELGLAHVAQQQQLELENLAKRIVAFDGVQSCSFYTVDGRALAFAGSDTATPQARHYPASVTIGDSLAGFARVVLDANHFQPDAEALLLSAWPIWLGALAVAFAFALHMAWRTSPRPDTAAEPAATPPSKAANAQDKAPKPAPPKPPSIASNTPEPAPSRTPRSAAPPADGPNLVLVANLFNAASLPADAKAHALDEVLRLARELAKAHQAEAKAVPGTGALLRFPPNRGLAAAVAGLELARRMEPAKRDDAQFRCALHRGGTTDDEAALADALLLTALAPRQALAVSDAALHCIGQLDAFRITGIPERNVAALAANKLGRCHVLHGIRV